MKNILKIFTINLLLIIFLLITLEFIATKIHQHIPCFFRGHRYFAKAPEFKYFSMYEFREPSLVKKVKKVHPLNIVLAGCSFTYGEGLKYDETFSAILSKYTKNNVYNLGIGGGSPREILYILRNEELLNKFVPERNNIKYFIYTYMGDHNGRLYYCNRPNVPFFLPQNNYTGLKYLEIPSKIICSNFVNYTQKFLLYKNFYNTNRLLKLYIMEIDKEVKNKFPNAEFIIVSFNNYFDEDIYNEAQKAGIKIINLEDYIKDINTLKYQISKEDSHPSKKAWETIVPIVKKELKL